MYIPHKHASSQGWQAISLLAILRVLRRWNQTGQKHAGSADIANTFLPRYDLVLWAMVIVTYLTVFLQLSRTVTPWAPRVVPFTASLVLTATAIVFKVAFTVADAPELVTQLQNYTPTSIEHSSLIVQARIIFSGILALLLLTVIPALLCRINYARRRKGAAASSRRRAQGPGCLPAPIHHLLTLLLITQSRTTNIPAFFLFQVQAYFLEAFDLSATERSLTSILLQHVSYFALGGSNAISSVDLSNAYNGVTGYNVTVVGVLTFISNWAGPVWWTSATMLSQSRRLSEVQRRHDHLQHISLVSLFAAGRVLFVMIACTILRTHLFIWTVFSPKYLYVLAWNVGQHLLVDLLYGTAMLWTSSCQADSLQHTASTAVF